MDHRLSTRADDGLARPSVAALIGELDNGMRGRGSNHMNITGMNLAILKTLMNHVNKLQDRVETLEGRIQDGELDVKRSSAYEMDGEMRYGEYDMEKEPGHQTSMKKAKAGASTTITDVEQEPNDSSDLARYEKLKSDLQKLYGGRAQEYDPTAGGLMFPPHGTCMSELTLKMMDTMQEQITKSEKEVVRLEQVLKMHPYTPVSPHPMIVLRPGISKALSEDLGQASRNAETRNQLLRDIAKQEGERRILQEGVDFWSTVKPASVEYMQQVRNMFVDKNQLRAKLWENHGLRPSAW